VIFLTREEIGERKAYIAQYTDAKDILFRYGIDVRGNRCRGFCHGSRDYDITVFRDGVKCWVCNKYMDVFDIVQHFEHCDYWTAFQILGGTDVIDDSAKKKMEEAKKRRDFMIACEKKRKNNIAKIVKKLNEYSANLKNCEPLTDEWADNYNKWQYCMYLFDYFTEKKK